MVYFLIDNSYISDSLKYNHGFFWNSGIIPINIDYKLDKIPYYENSRHLYRDIRKIQDAGIFTKSTKPIKNSSRISELYYNPKKRKGQITKYEYVPIKQQKYNIVPKHTTVRCVHIWSNDDYVSGVCRDLNCYREFLHNSIKIKFILEDIKYTIHKIRYTWIPFVELSIGDARYLDISDFIKGSVEFENGDFFINIVLDYE